MDLITHHRHVAEQLVEEQMRPEPEPGDPRPPDPPCPRCEHPGSRHDDDAPWGPACYDCGLGGGACA